MMVSNNLLAAVVGILMVVLLGLFLNLLHCVTSCLEGTQRGEGHEDVGMPTEGTG